MALKSLFLLSILRKQMRYNILMKNNNFCLSGNEEYSPFKKAKKAQDEVCLAFSSNEIYPVCIAPVGVIL